MIEVSTGDVSGSPAQGESLERVVERSILHDWSVSPLFSLHDKRPGEVLTVLTIEA